MGRIALHRKQMFKIGIPYWIYVNGQAVGIMKGREANINMPAGDYDIAVRIVLQLFRWQFHIGGSRRISVSDGEPGHLWITDRERWWNILFDIDMVLWIAEFFITLPHPWNLVYKIVSNGFFVVWLLRIWIIRESYFVLEQNSNSHFKNIN